MFQAAGPDMENAVCVLGWWRSTVARTSVLAGELSCRMLDLQLMGD